MCPIQCFHQESQLPALFHRSRHRHRERDLLLVDLQLDLVRQLEGWLYRVSQYEKHDVCHDRGHGRDRGAYDLHEIISERVHRLLFR